ncbi:MAG: DUF6252 family protein [Bacteroidota bacterium]
MKTTLLFCLFALLLVGCTEEPQPDGLPPATTTGEDTFGCLINGETFAIWTERSGSEERFVTSGFGSRGSNIIQAGNRVWKGEDTDVSIQIPPPLVADSTYQFSAVVEVFANVRYSSGRTRFLTTDLISGSVTLSRWDREARIISGTFEFTVANAGDTVRITEGRFDISEVNL